MKRAKLTVLDKQSRLDFSKNKNSNDKSSDKSDNKYGDTDYHLTMTRLHKNQDTSTDYTEETKLDTSMEQVEELTDSKQKMTKTPPLNPLDKISLIDIVHRHKMLIKKGASELVVVYYHAKSQNNDTTPAQFKATQAKLSAPCLSPKMLEYVVCEMEEDLSGKPENFIKNGYIKFNIKLDIKT